MKNQTKKWVRAGLETLIHGGAAALASSMSAAMIDSKDWALLSTNCLKLAAATFMTNGGIRFVQWWANNPLPPDDDTKPPLAGPQPTISLNPLSKVQTLSASETDAGQSTKP